MLPTYNFNIMTPKILLKKSQLSTFIDLLSKQSTDAKQAERNGDPDAIYAPFCRSSLSLLLSFRFPLLTNEIGSEKKKKKTQDARKQLR